VEAAKKKEKSINRKVIKFDGIPVDEKKKTNSLQAKSVACLAFHRIPVPAG
jgi:hypothetical protein